MEPARRRRIVSKEEAQSDHLILICFRYEGIDERVEEYYADKVISIGDYVLMGGDLPAQVFLEGLLRLLPGIVGKEESVKHESFSGPFLDFPVYGKPIEWQDMKVPEVLLSGDHKKIASWRQNQASKKKIQKRFDWFSQSPTTKEERELAVKYIPPHYIAMMHTDVMIKGGRIGETSVTSLDIHDTARSAATYGIENVFLVTPLKDQQKIVRTFLGFWHSKEGKKYNTSRYDAVARVRILENYQEVIDAIREKEGKEPVVIATSAKAFPHSLPIDYFSQGAVWQHERPVLILFGTGQGLSQNLVQKSDFLLDPINGLTDYNNLSVRAAVAIILDRW